MREQDACCVLSLIKLMVIILYANVSSVVHQLCSCSRLQSAVFLPKRPNYCSARRGLVRSIAGQPLPAPRPHQSFLWPCLGRENHPRGLGRKTRSRTAEQLVFCFPGLPRKAWEWQEALGCPGRGAKLTLRGVLPKARGRATGSLASSPLGHGHSHCHLMAFTHRCFYTYFFTQSTIVDNETTKPKCSVFFPIIFALHRGAWGACAERCKAEVGTNTGDAPVLCICYQGVTSTFTKGRGTHPPVRVTRSRRDCWLEHPPRQPLRQDEGQRRGRAPERPIPSGVEGCSTLTAARNLQGLRDKGAVREKPGQRDKRAYSVPLLGR